MNKQWILIFALILLIGTEVECRRRSSNYPRTNTYPRRNNDGSPDRRYKENRIPGYNKDGSRDRRYNYY